MIAAKGRALNGQEPVQPVDPDPCGLRSVDNQHDRECPGTGRSDVQHASQIEDGNQGSPHVGNAGVERGDVSKRRQMADRCRLREPRKGGDESFVAEREPEHRHSGVGTVAEGHRQPSGALDQDLLFYLKARGIPAHEAEALLILGVPDADGAVVLLEPSLDVPLGGRVF